MDTTYDPLTHLRREPRERSTVAAPAPDPRILEEVRAIVDSMGIRDPAERAKAEQRVELEILTARTDAFRQTLGYSVQPSSDASSATGPCVAVPAPRLVVGNAVPGAPEAVALAASAPYPILGKNLLMLQMECGWSYDEMAAQVGMARSALVDACQGRTKPQNRNLKAMADAFSQRLARPVTVTDLLGSPESL